MKSFNQLTLNGRIRRLRVMAWEALSHYDLQVARLSKLSTSFNTIFRIDTQDGQKYVLRINFPNERSPIDIQSEMLWLDALSNETDIPVTHPVRTKDGKLMVTIETEGVPEPRHCAVFHWVNGRTYSKPTLPTITKIGAVMAQLQNHADTFNPPTPFCKKRYNNAWNFGKPTRIYSTEKDDIFTEEIRAIIKSAISKIQAYLDKLYQDPTDMRFLHADLHAWNVKLHQGHIQVLDFDDTMWCYPIQDIGISLYYLEREPNAPQVRAAFKQGYTAHRAWPEKFAGEIDIIIAQRTIDLLSLIVLEEKNPEFAGYLDNYLQTRIPQLKGFVQN